MAWTPGKDQRVRAIHTIEVEPGRIIMTQYLLTDHPQAMEQWADLAAGLCHRALEDMAEPIVECHGPEEP